MNNIQRSLYILCSIITIATSAGQPDIAATLQTNNSASSYHHVLDALRTIPERMDGENLLEIGSAVAVHALTKKDDELRLKFVSRVIEDFLAKHNLDKTFYSAQIPLPSLLWYLYPVEWNIEIGTKELASALYLLAQSKETYDKSGQKQATFTISNMLVYYLWNCQKINNDYSSTVATWPMPIYKSQMVFMTHALAGTLAKSIANTVIKKEFDQMCANEFLIGLCAQALQQHNLVKATGEIFNYGIVSSLLHSAAQRTGLPQDKLDILFSGKCYAKTPMQKLAQYAVDHCFNQAVDRFASTVTSTDDAPAE